MARISHNAKILYLDIETAPGIGYFWSLWDKFTPIDFVINSGYTLCVAAMWEGDRHVEFFDIRNGEEQMLRKFWQLLDEADMVVHYNGTKFDIPTLNREFVRHGMAPPSHFHQIDLLKTVRKQFRFHSNKLDFVCKELGLGTKVKHKGIALWKGVMDGNPRDWRTMEAYNKRDVKLLKRLYKTLLPWIHNHPNLGMWVNNPQRPVCPSCGTQALVSKGVQYNTKAASYQRYRCKKCHTPVRSRLRSAPTNPNVTMRTP